MNGGAPNIFRKMMWKFMEMMLAAASFCNAGYNGKTKLTTQFNNKKSVILIYKLRHTNYTCEAAFSS